MELISFALKLSGSLILGVLIGLERQWRGHPAGLRTNALVCLGATLFVSLSTLKGDEDSKSRIASYVVSGIGFLGGGVILRDGLNIRGMNTAATLWCAAAIGTLSGAGFLIQAFVGTVSILFVHLFIRPFAHWIDKKRKLARNIEMTYQLKIQSETGKQQEIRFQLLNVIQLFPKMTLQGISIENSNLADKDELVADIFSMERNDGAMEEITWRLNQESGIESISWSKSN